MNKHRILSTLAAMLIVAASTGANALNDTARQLSGAAPSDPIVADPGPTDPNGPLR